MLVKLVLPSRLTDFKLGQLLKTEMSIVFTELGIIKGVKASHEPKANALIVVNLEFSPKLTVSSLLDQKKADSPSVVTEPVTLDFLVFYQICYVLN